MAPQRGWGRTPALERYLNHGAALALALTGIALAVFEYVLEPPADDPFTIVSHPWQAPSLSLHVLAAPLGVLGLGLLLRQHVLPRLLDSSYRRSRRSGILLAATSLPMIASGYLLQVTTSEWWLKTWLVVHLATGLAWTCGWLLHLASARGWLRR